MARLLVHVEGQTEEVFVNEVLRGHLQRSGYESVSARIVGNNRLRRNRGGIRSWPVVSRDILSHLKQDATCIATTMVDFYALPREGTGAWPGRKAAASFPTPLKSRAVEDALREDIAQQLADFQSALRFVPFVVLHEFEGLLFSDCEAFCRGIGRPDLEPQLKAIRSEFETPEDINDSPGGAPSKRLTALIPDYQKVLTGSIGILEIGLNRVRSECPHFSDWLRRLEALV